MCGIAGIWFRDGRGVDRRALVAMARALAHRGPDGEGIHVEAAIGLAHRRLKVIDLSDAAAQPMWLPDRSLALVFNGEIHNFRELALELERAGVRLRTRSDTEVLLWGWRIWGEECLERLNGMWAAAFWEPARQRLVLTRDRFGIKPLVYSVRGARLAFASEPKAILAAFPEERVPDRALVRDFLSGGLPDGDEATFFANLRSVLPGQFLVFDARNATARRYWRFEPGEERPRPDAHERFGDLIVDAVRLRLTSDVPVGVCLSGGLDSSLVTRIAASRSSGPLKCFSLRQARAQLDESRYAAMVADDPRRYELRWVEPRHDDLLATASAIVWHHDAPTPIRGRYSQWHVLREASRHVTVLLNGQGADELLAGYPRFLLPYLLDRMDPRVPGRRRGVGGLIGELVRLGRVSTGVHRVLPGLVLRLLSRRFGLRRARMRLGRSCTASAPIAPHRLLSAWAERGSERPYRSRLNNALWNELRHAGLPEVLHSEDALSMAFSLETRLPFLDHRLVELCFSLPFDEKIDAGWTKALLRRASGPWLPEAVRWRRAKLGFPADFATLLAGGAGIQVLRDVLLDRAALERGWIDRDWILARLGGPVDRAASWTRAHLWLAWSMLTLELWCRQFLDGDRLFATRTQAHQLNPHAPRSASALPAEAGA